MRGSYFVRKSRMLVIGEHCEKGETGQSPPRPPLGFTFPAFARFSPFSASHGRASPASPAGDASTWGHPARCCTVSVPRVHREVNTPFLRNPFLTVAGIAVPDRGSAAIHDQQKVGPHRREALDSRLARGFLRNILGRCSADVSRMRRAAPPPPFAQKSSPSHYTQSVPPALAHSFLFSIIYLHYSH